MSMLKELMLKDYVTLTGTMFGVVVIAFSIFGLLFPEPWWIPLAGLMWAGALLCDLLDGMVARKLNQVNEIGRELDSLSDAISFTAAPGILMLCASLRGEFPVFLLPQQAVIIGVFALVFFGLTRLAWFNIANVGEGYTGITTPMTAAFIISFYLCHHYFIDLAIYFPAYHDALLPISNFFGNTLSITFIMMILGFLNVATFLRYGKAVQKRRGIWKYLIIIFIILLMTTIIIGRGLMGSFISKFTIHIMMLTSIFALLGYYVYGFYNYLTMPQRGEPLKTLEDKRNRV
ncbi:MAG: CDP-alcohol phosphatidyltransferase family protein [Candidatus Helarchaeota archaeon]